MSNRLAALQVSKRWTVAGLHNALHQFPSDATVNDIFKDPWTKDTIMVFESPTFAEVPDGMTIPLFPIGYVKKEEP